MPANASRSLMMSAARVASRAALAVATLAALTGCGGGFVSNPEAGLLELDKNIDRTRLLAEGEESLSQTVTLTGAGEYALLDLGAAQPGDEWALTVQAETATVRQLTLALLDGDQTLLCRDKLAPGVVVRHVVRAATEHLYVGVSSSAAAAVNCEVVAAVKHDVPVPPPQAQVVWLNFAGGQGVEINGELPESFGPFTAADCGASYADQSDTLKALIAAAMRTQFAAYNVTILSSDETPEPAGPHSTVHFGGDDTEHLGMSDGVDQYNANPSDAAIVYTRAFGAYEAMGLSAPEMAQMVANAASHELAHLLGVFHTRDAHSLLDDSRSAWDLVGASALTPAPVAETVFPIGVEDADLLLAQAVGLRSGAAR